MSEERYDRKELFGKAFSWLKKLAADALEKRLDIVPRAHLRPPGALVEALFLATCEGSGRCVAACPHGAIRLTGGEAAHTGTTPAITPAAGPCYMCPDVPCSAACPSGALAPTGRDEIRIGLAMVDRITCLAWLGSTCDRCLVACPVGARAIRRVCSDGPEVLSAGCSGCGMCTSACPVRPRAIRIRPL